ncbi:MAG: hypothetical protein AAGM22_26030 [Acidobacteriota bacterium]
MKTLAYVVSSHGFGHAARSAAVLSAFGALHPDVRLCVVTTTPRWFFEQSLDVPCDYCEVTTDLGLVQASSLEEDLEATLERLESMFGNPDRMVAPIADALREIRPDLVACDISPWGLEAARGLGLPTVLLENFTWDWIYRGYGDPRLDHAADRFSPLFRADHHLRLEPYCGPLGDATPVPPVARPSRRSREAVRQDLGVPESASMALVTMGGVPWSFDDVEAQLEARSGRHVLVIAGGAPEVKRFPGCVLIPHQSDFYHPDMVAAADVVVGKLGYSTVAEVAESGAAFLYVPRPRFRESPALEAWVLRHLAARRFSPDDLTARNWLARLDAALEALSAESPKASRGGGARRAAEALGSWLDPPP